LPDGTGLLQSKTPIPNCLKSATRSASYISSEYRYTYAAYIFNC